jgi:hypothetical protein
MECILACNLQAPVLSTCLETIDLEGEANAFFVTKPMHSLRGLNDYWDTKGGLAQGGVLSASKLDYHVEKAWQ